MWEALPIGICSCDRDGIIWSFNRRAAELWGRSPEIGDRSHRFNGAHQLFLSDGHPLPHHEGPMAEVLRSCKAARDRRTVVERPDGTRVTTLSNVDPLFDDDGILVGAVNCFQDITELTRAEERVREDEQRFRDVLEAMPVAVYTTDADGKITFCNNAAVELAGRSADLGSDEWCVTWRLYTVFTQVSESDQLLQGDSDYRRASFDKLRMRVFLRATRIYLILSLSKDAGWRCRDMRQGL